MDENIYDTVIIGGGLAGLVAAVRLARAGQRVRLCEASAHLGGRARTLRTHGRDFNLGPHALYRAGAAQRVLDDLGLEVAGAPAPVEGALAWRAGAAHTLPVGFVSLLTTGLLPLKAKLEVAGLLARLERLDPGAWAGRSVAAWFAASGLSAPARGLLEALVRLSTYTNAPDLLDAGATIAQLQRAGAGVRYLHGGWGKMISTLANAAREAGAEILAEARAERVLFGERGRAEGVELRARGRARARAVVLAVPPKVAARLAPEACAGLAEGALVARAACLDVALEALPRPRRVFGLGIDAADYASVHTSVARLGDGHVAHVARYLAPGEDAPPREALVEVFERLQPGFRRHAVHMAYHPHMIVSHGMPRADREGRRPGPRVVEGLFVAGDWVGEEGMLADAAAASGDAAAQAILHGEAAARAA